MWVDWPHPAPEILKEQPYNEKVDCWSLGVMIYKMLSGEYPFSSMGGETELFNTIKKGKFNFSENWDSISEEAKDLVVRLLNIEPDNRPSMAEVNEHPWMNMF